AGDAQVIVDPTLAPTKARAPRVWVQVKRAVVDVRQRGQRGVIDAIVSVVGPMLAVSAEKPFVADRDQVIAVERLEIARHLVRPARECLTRGTARSARLVGELPAEDRRIVAIGEVAEAVDV